MEEGKKWYLIFYDVKGSKAFAKSTFRSKISRELAKTPVVPLQQSVWAVLQTPQNKTIVDRLVEIIKAQNAKLGFRTYFWKAAPLVRPFLGDA